MNEMNIDLNLFHIFLEKRLLHIVLRFEANLI